MTWLLLVDVLLPSLGSMPLQEKRYFVEDFFGYVSSQRNNQAEQDRSMMSSRSEDEDIPGPVDMPTVTATPQADGLGWMEDVWAIPPVVHIERPETYWPELSRVMDSTCPESARLTELTSPTQPKPRVAWDEASEGTPRENRAVMGPKTLEEHLADSARRV